MTSSMTSIRNVFYVSDGTGITAEAFGHALLVQFDTSFRSHRLPFVNSVAAAQQAVAQINHEAVLTPHLKPLVFTTVVHPDVLAVFAEGCLGRVFNLFGTFIQPIETELGLKSNLRVGRFSDTTQSKEYHDRIDAIHFALAHDDGQSHLDLAKSDVILIGVSRCGKTPTALYLAMQHGLKAANYPLIPDDFERRQLPSVLLTHKDKLFGLTIAPERLAEIRHERRPDSRYASLINCRYEVDQAETMMRRHGIRSLSTTHKSIEEIATTVLQTLRPDRLIY